VGARHQRRHRFLLGFVVYPSWQVAVEPAQVVAGLVHYPAGNAFYVYETKLWTILHQIGAVLLRAGVSEIVLSRGVERRGRDGGSAGTRHGHLRSVQRTSRWRWPAA
jgi:hypothetical protein